MGLVSTLCRIFVGLALILAAVSKIVDFGLFLSLLHKHYLVGRSLCVPIAVAIVSMEMALGLLLLPGVAVPWSTFLGAALFLVFSIVVGISLSVGSDPGRCGCFGAWDRTRAGGRLILRNMGLAGLALLGSPGILVGRPILFCVAVTLSMGATASIFWTAPVAKQNVPLDQSRSS